MDKEQLSDYVSRSQELIEESPQMDEANTKVRLIQPLISLLGWNPHSSEVELEYPVQMGAGTKKVDYALMLEGTPVVFIEVKGCDTSLSESHLNQLKSYMRIAGVDWGVLTNGNQFEILKRRPNTSRPDEITLGSLPISDLVDKFHLINALSRESIDTGKSEKIAENIERIQEAVSSLQENKEQVADRIVDVINDEVGSPIPVKIENNAKAFVDDLIASLQSHGAFDTKRTEDVSWEEGDNGKKEDFWTHVESELGISFHDGIVELNDEFNAVQNFLGFIELLFNEGYVTKGDLPYNPGGPKRYLLNTSPKHIDGTEMYNPHEVIDGVFVETHNSTTDKKRYMRNLAEDFTSS